MLVKNNERFFMECINRVDAMKQQGCSRKNGNKKTGFYFSFSPRCKKYFFARFCLFLFSVVIFLAISYLLSKIFIFYSCLLCILGEHCG